ncbi:MAG: class II glutamine amidotransferase [Gemmatimonadaceae bacterium]|nr:class II glutamine amidotransferase [Gemmatimonadaceae bacterium]
MCRFTLYLGPPIKLSTLVTEPEHSLIHQSSHATERAEPLNGDGFGIGWYSPRLHSEPATFHQITPAWSDRNLKSIAKVVASACVMAHVRAATPGSTVDLSNCHPFAYDNYLLMHNGHIGGFRRLRRRLLEDLTDEAYGIIRGSTDTEHLFAIFVDEIVRHGCPVDAPGEGGRNGEAALGLAQRLSSAIERTLAVSARFGNGEPSFLNVAVTDGDHVAVCRFASGDGAQPETLYLLHGELYPPAGRDFPQRRPTDEGEATVVASERLTTDARWQAVPANHMLVLDRWVRPRVLPMDASGRIAPAAVGV